MSTCPVKYLGPSNFNYSLSEQKKDKTFSFTRLFSKAVQEINNTKTETWDALKGCFVWHSPLQKDIYHIASCMHPNKGLNNGEIDQVIQALRSPHFKFIKEDLCNILKNADAEIVRTILIEGIKQSLTEDKTLNLRAIECVDFERLSFLTDIDVDKLKRDMLFEKELQMIRFFKDETKEHVLRTASSELGRFIVNIIDVFVKIWISVGGSLFGHKFKSSSDDISSIALPLKLLIMLAAVHWVIDTFVGYEVLVAQYVLGGVFLGLVGDLILAMIILYPLFVWLHDYFSGLPQEIEHLENLTQRAKERELGFVAGRDSEINTLIDKLEKNGHVLLHGESGVGKSGMVKGLARRISIEEVPGFLRNKTVYSLNLQQLSNTKESSAAVIENFMSETKKFKDKVIVFVNHAHDAWKPSEHCAEELNKLLDQYPNVILSMTEGGMSLPEVAGDDNIRKIPKYHVKETNKKQTMNILREYARVISPEEYIDDRILREIFKKSNAVEGSVSQPGKAINMLADILTVHRPIGDAELLKRKKELEGELESIKATHYHGVGMVVNLPTNEVIDTVTLASAELADIQKKLDDQIAKVNFLREVRALFVSLEDAKYEQALKVQNPDKKFVKECQKNWLALKHVVLPIIDRLAQEYAEETKDYYSEITVEKCKSSRKGKEKV